MTYQPKGEPLLATNVKRLVGRVETTFLGKNLRAHLANLESCGLHCEQKLINL